MSEKGISQSITKIFIFGVLFFLLIFVTACLRDIKDVFIMTAPGGGAFFLVSLKSLVFLPKLILFGLFILFYRRDNLPHLMFFTLLLFLVFFISFHLWIHPHADLFHPEMSQVQAWIQKASPESHQWIQLWGMWTYALYYFLADLWGIVAVALFFFALSNQTFNINEAKWAYPLFGLFGSFGTLLGGQSLWILGKNFLVHTGFVLLGVMLVLLFWSWVMKNHVIPVPSPAREKETPRTPTASFRWAYLGLILVILSAFEFCQHVLQMSWTSYIKVMYFSAGEYSHFMGQLSYYMGLAGVILFFLTFWMIWAFGWVRSALIPPIIVCLTVLGAIMCQKVPTIAHFVEGFFHTAPSSFIFWILTGQKLIFSGITATLFVATKEMAYIPLPITTKARGKATVDLLFGRMGILLGSFIFTGFYFGEGPGQDISSTLLLIVLGVAVIWIVAVLLLGNFYKRITA